MSDDEMLVAQSPKTPFPASTITEGVLHPKDDGDCNDQSRKSRPRKRVTFDMQLKIHTIPNRIPVYERRPAYNNMGPPAHYSSLLNRGQNQRSLLPRPLDIKTRDRYLVGAANLSAKRIIDIFGSANNRHVSSPSPNRQRTSGYRNARRVPQYASPTISSSARLTQSLTESAATERHEPVMSRAAANLKQITDAIGEESPRNGEEQYFPRDAEMLEKISNGVTGERDISANSVYGSQQTRTRVQSSPSRVQSYSYTQNNLSNSHHGGRFSHGPERLRSASLATPRPEPLDGGTGRLPIVTSEQIQLNNRYMTSRVNTGKDEQMRLSAHGRSDLYKSNSDEYANDKDFNGNVPNRTPSRCSTIDAYAIDGPDHSNVNSFNLSANGSATTRRIGSGRGQRRLITTPPSRAWEGFEMAITQPSLQVSALRTAVNLPHHQSSPISSHLSTSTSQRTWSSRNTYS